MNAVTEFLASISDADLRVAVSEMKQLETTAVLPHGVVRGLSSELAARAGVADIDARKIIESAVLRLAAYRWAGV